MKKLISDIRKDFPILKTHVHGKPLIYLDNASTTQKPQCVLDVLMNFYTQSNANIFRGVHVFAENATMLYENARDIVARFIGARSQEIVFMRGTTSAINSVVVMWGEAHVATNDEIVVTELEHHANLLPWQRLARKKGAMLRCIPVLSNGTLDISRLDKIITKKTKIVAVTAVSNAIGTHVDLTTIISQAKAVGARVLVDAAQLVPHDKIDVRQLGCDFLVFSGHKLLAPTGVGVLFINKEIHDECEPYEVGGGMVINSAFACATSGYSKEGLGLPTWVQAPHKFEAGTPPIAQAIALGAAIEYLCNTVDFCALQKYEASLSQRFIEGINAIESVHIVGPHDELMRTGHMVSFTVDGFHAHDVAAFLDTKGIAVRAGHHCAQPLAQKLGYEASVRASFYLYNTYDEIDLCISALRELQYLSF